MNKDLPIDPIEVIVVVPKTQRYACAQGMSEQFIPKVTTKGVEGIVGAPSFGSCDFDRNTAPCFPRWSASRRWIAGSMHRALTFTLPPAATGELIGAKHGHTDRI
jgi:hypothetical protein